MDKANEKTEKKAKKTLNGKVVSNKMQKTIIVEREFQEQDKKCGKFLKRSKRFFARVPENISCAEGDLVAIQETRPFSKNTTFIVREIIKKAEVISQ